MKLSNLLQLTAQHHYAVVRHFGISPMDIRMVNQVYQPIAGAFAIALYHTLCSHLPADAVGRSDPAPLSALFLSCSLEPNERGRKCLAEETSKLEAAGLLRSYRRVDAEGEVEGYEFRIEPPLNPYEFFEVHHLWLLLKEKLGPNAAEAVRRSFFHGAAGSGAFNGLPSPEGETAWEDLTSPFYDIYRMSVPSGTEQAAKEAASGREAAAEPLQLQRLEAASGEFGKEGFRADELLRRFPRSSPNRRHVERILKEPGLLAEINFFAGKFELTIKQTVSLLDEEDMFTPEGRLNSQRFEAGASGLFLQVNKKDQERDRLRSKQTSAVENSGDSSESPANETTEQERDIAKPYWLEVPAQFAGQCDTSQYNALLANAPYTRVLKLFFEPAAVPGPVQEAFLGMNVNYRLPDEVINVLIHYIRTNDLDWTRGFLEAIAANVAGKHIRTFEHAVVYFRKAAEIRRNGGGGSSSSGSGAGSSGGYAADSGQRIGGDAADRGAQGGGRRSGSAGTRRGRPPKPIIPVVKKPEGKAATEEDIKRILDMAKQLNNDQ